MTLTSETEIDSFLSFHRHLQSVTTWKQNRTVCLRAKRISLRTGWPTFTVRLSTLGFMAVLKPPSLLFMNRLGCRILNACTE